MNNFSGCRAFGICQKCKMFWTVCKYTKQYIAHLFEMRSHYRNQTPSIIFGDNNLYKRWDKGNLDILKMGFKEFKHEYERLVQNNHVCDYMPYFEGKEMTFNKSETKKSE